MSLMQDRYWEHVRYKEAAPTARYIEISPTWRDELPRRVGASGQLIRTTLADARTILDVGAGNRAYQGVFRNLGLTGEYRSADVDRTHQHHDYTDFLSITDRFDAIVMFELIEHLPLDVGVTFLEHARRLIQPAGVLMLSTPNPHHPNHVWRVEVTHIRPWPMADLYGVLRLVGFDEVQLCRQYLGSWKRRLAVPLTKALYRFMELDHAQTILAIAR